MTITAGQSAIINRIRLTINAPSIVTPNDPGSPALPRWVVQTSASQARTATIGGSSDATVEVVVRVETEHGQHTGGSEGSAALVQILENRFIPGDRFDGMTVMERPRVTPPIVSDGVYAVPVIIRADITY